MIRRILIGLAVVVGLFLLVLWLTFPTAALVRRVLDGMPLPAGTRVEFGRATLRPWGLHLEQLALRRPDGGDVVQAEWLHVQPSLLGLLGARPGFPWTIGSRLCGGDVDIHIDDDGATQTFDARWNDLDLGRCTDGRGPRPTLTGHATGSAKLQQPRNAQRPTGAGDFTMRATAWALPQLGTAVLHADVATARWVLLSDRLTIDTADIQGPDLDLHASGEVRLLRSMQDAHLDLQVSLEPLPGMPRELRRLLQDLPRREDGRYEFRITGTPDAPHVEPP